MSSAYDCIYCDPLSTWATVEDLYERFGDEYVDKLATRRVWDVDSEQYVADESTEGRLRVLNLALCDAREFLKGKLACCFQSIQLLDEKPFPSIKQWHIKLTIEALKVGGDCFSCKDCITSFDEFCKCSTICSDDGECLVSKNTFISVSEAKFCCEEYARGCKCKC